MSKIRLQLDQLTVDSFATSMEGGPRGTVRAEQCTCHTNCTCPGCPSCDHTCQESCYGTCAPAYSCNTMETDKRVICCLQ